MRKFIPVMALALGLSACVTPVGPVEVTRFHAADAVQELGKGTIVVMPGPDENADSLEYRTYAAAVMRELETQGYASPVTGQSAQYNARISLDRFTRDSEGRRSPVSVGVGGSTGSYGSGIGVGIGINLGGGSKPLIISELFVAIARDGETANLWEGRAISEARKGSPAAETSLAAAKLATSLFAGFPGESGETVEVE